MPRKDISRRQDYNRDYYLQNRDKALIAAANQREYARLTGSDEYRKWDRTRRGNRRWLLNALKNFPCADCGHRYPPYVMDFDHVRGVKLFTLGRAGNGGISEADVIAEALKCDVVCANCHRERTYGLKIAPTDSV